MVNGLKDDFLDVHLDLVLGVYLHRVKTKAASLLSHELE